MNAPASRIEPQPAARLRQPRFGSWSSLVTRILVVNLLALFALAGGILYLDSFRARMLETRASELVQQGDIIAHFLADEGLREASLALANFTTPRGTRVRVYAPDGALMADNWRNPQVARFALEDPTTEGFRRQSAVLIDRMIAFLSQQERLPEIAEPMADVRQAWPEAEAAFVSGRAQTAAWRTPDRLVILQAAVPVAKPADNAAPGAIVLLTVDTPDVLDSVRRERQTSFTVFLVVLGFSLLLSLYLARTVVVPLRQLALAAHRVRLGRARDVVVPRLPHRRDEIGALARALADMTATLRHRIDATEAFAADVAHELKNPLASLRSAVEALGSVRDRAARAQLFGLINADVQRIDRLISDISAASRIDAELSRTRLHPVDLAALASGTVAAMLASGPLPQGIRVRVKAPDQPLLVAADADRLGQVLNNLIDNAISFSPIAGQVQVQVVRHESQIVLSVEDEGPGVPPEARDAIFERFYSERPAAEHFGQHSGLGLSIARAILEAMDGQIRVEARADGLPGACFVVSLPAL